MATNYFWSIGIPCLLYIDDCLNGQLQVDLTKGAYAEIQLVDDHNFAVAQSAIFLVAYVLVRLGYFLGLKKSILVPQQIVPYLGFCADSANEVFHLIPEKKCKFVDLVHATLQQQYAQSLWLFLVWTQYAQSPFRDNGSFGLI